MSDCGKNISDRVISSLLSRIRINYIAGADTAVLPPFSNTPAPLPCTALSCLLPYEDIPYSGIDVVIDGKLYHTHKGDCLIFPEGCSRHFFRNDAGHRSIWAHFHFHLEPDLSFLNFFHVPGVISGPGAVRCRELICALNRNCRNLLSGNILTELTPRLTGGLPESLEDQANAFLLLKEILAVSQPRESLFPALTDFQELENAVLWIRKHKFEKITLDDLARCCHLSRSSFEKKFRRLFGSSPGSYLIDLKLAATEELLRNTSLSCAEIAERSGFSNQFIFSRLFRKRYGISPRDYRKRILFS